MKCPANSHYAVCADLCSASCDGLTDIVPCAKSCKEGCECNVGFLFNGEKCVKEAECGCYDNGKTYKVQFRHHPVTMLQYQCCPLWFDIAICFFCLPFNCYNLFRMPSLVKKCLRTTANQSALVSQTKDLSVKITPALRTPNVWSGKDVWLAMTQARTSLVTTGFRYL